MMTACLHPRYLASLREDDFCTMRDGYVECEASTGPHMYDNQAVAAMRVAIVQGSQMLRQRSGISVLTPPSIVFSIDPVQLSVLCLFRKNIMPKP